MIFFNKNENLIKSVKIKINSNIIENEFNNKLLVEHKKIYINGFRAGKIPINNFIKTYGNSIKYKVINSLMYDFFLKIIKKNNINLLTIIDFIPEKYKIGNDLVYLVRYEIYPKIDIKKLNNIKIYKPIVNITNLDIDRVINLILKQKSIWKKSNLAAVKYNRLTLNFSGIINNKKIKELRIKNFLIVLGKNNIPKKLENSCINKNIGDKFFVKINFKKNINKKFQNKEILFFINIKNIEYKKIPELNEKFIKSLKIKSGKIENFRIELKKNMLMELNKAIFNNIKTQILNQIINLNEVNIPTKLIKQTIQQIKTESKKYFNIDKKYIKKYFNNELIYKQAKIQILTNLYFYEIKKYFNLKLKEKYIKTAINDLNHLYRNSNNFNNLYKNKKIAEKINYLAIEKQIINKILKLALIKNKKMNFFNLVNNLIF